VQLRIRLGCGRASHGACRDGAFRAQRERALQQLRAAFTHHQHDQVGRRTADHSIYCSIPPTEQSRFEHRRDPRLTQNGVIGPSASGPRTSGGSFKENAMLYTIAIILLVLWLLGLVSGYTIGAFIHVLLVIALVLFLVGLVSRRRLV
jgi:Flp pilus assembly protein TadB